MVIRAVVYFTWSGGRLVWSFASMVYLLFSQLFGKWVGWCVVWLLVCWLVSFSDGSLVGGFQLRRNVEDIALADFPLQRNLVTIL